MHLVLLIITALTELQSGTPGIADYDIPAGFQTEFLPDDSTWSVTEGDSGSFTIVPLVLSDTLDLPQLRGWNDKGDTLFFQPPMIVVSPVFPDTLMDPSFPVYPCFMNIPPGLPEDYARNLSFWLVWTGPPGFPWLQVAGALILAGGLAWYLVHRRKKAQALPEQKPQERIPAGREAEKEALALLESENYIHGRWAELYAEIDRQYRITVAGRFGIINRALTLNQISGSLASTGDGRKFLEDASPLTREIILQLYADWGSSREKSGAFIRKLAQLRREWSR